jgi:branched-chain amino acid aminotransferase
MTRDERPSGGAVWINGALVAPADAVVSVFDHGFTVGDGVFETLKVVSGQPFALTRHLERLRRSAAALGLDVPAGDDKLRAIVAETIAASDVEVGRARITLTGGPAALGSGRGDGPPTLVVAVGPLDPASLAPDTTAVTVPWPRNERSAVCGIKTTSYAENVVALAEAARAGASEAIMANLAGNVCEGTGTNVFVVQGERLVTPPLSSGCLAGVTRALLLELLDDAVEDDVPIDALGQADEVLLTSSTRDVQPLRELDGRRLPGARGARARRAARALAELQADNLDP